MFCSILEDENYGVFGDGETRASILCGDGEVQLNLSVSLSIYIHMNMDVNKYMKYDF